MSISDYIEQTLKESKLDVIDFELHLDEFGQIRGESSNVIRFRVNRTKVGEAKPDFGSDDLDVDMDT